MEIGGNKRFQDYLRSKDIEKPDYHSNTCQNYKEMLEREAEIELGIK